MEEEGRYFQEIKSNNNKYIILPELLVFSKNRLAELFQEHCIQKD